MGGDSGRRDGRWLLLRRQRYVVLGGLIVTLCALAWIGLTSVWEELMSQLYGEPEVVVSPRVGSGRRAVVTFAEAKLNASLLDAGVCLRDYR